MSHWVIYRSEYLYVPALSAFLSDNEDLPLKVRGKDQLKIQDSKDVATETLQV